MRSLTRWCVRSEDKKFSNVGLLYDDVMFGIEQLPPVNPQETVTEFADRCRECGKMKKGHWIQTNDFFINNDGQFIYKFICSECKSLSFFRKSNKKAIGANVCPYCGAKMLEESDIKQGLNYADGDTLMPAT